MCSGEMQRWKEVKMDQEAKMYQEVISKTNVTLIPLFAHGAEVGR